VNLSFCKGPVAVYICWQAFVLSWWTSPSRTQSLSDTRRSHVSVLITYSYAHFSNGSRILLLCRLLSCWCWLLFLFLPLQNYNVSWTCSGCYKSHDSKLVSKHTTTDFSNLQRDHTYSFYVFALTTFGDGKMSTTTATISRYFGQVQNLRQSSTNYTLTLQWDKPSDVEAKDIEVSCHLFFG